MSKGAAGRSIAQGDFPERVLCIYSSKLLRQGVDGVDIAGSVQSTSVIGG